MEEKFLTFDEAKEAVATELALAAADDDRDGRWFAYDCDGASQSRFEELCDAIGSSWSANGLDDTRCEQVMLWTIRHYVSSRDGGGDDAEGTASADDFQKRRRRQQRTDDKIQLIRFMVSVYLNEILTSPDRHFVLVKKKKPIVTYVRRKKRRRKKRDKQPPTHNDDGGDDERHEEKKATTANNSNAGNNDNDARRAAVAAAVFAGSESLRCMIGNDKPQPTEPAGNHHHDRERAIHSSTTTPLPPTKQPQPQPEKNDVDSSDNVDSADGGGKIVATLVVAEKDLSGWSWWKHGVRAKLQEIVFVAKLALDRRLPELLTSKDLQKERRMWGAKGDLFTKNRARWHRQYGPKSRHVYVAFAAVSPPDEEPQQAKGGGQRDDEQRQPQRVESSGHGNYDVYTDELMMVANRFADLQGLDCYLETSDARSRQIYEKHGYTVSGTETLTDPNDENNVVEGHFMVRKSPVPVN